MIFFFFHKKQNKHRIYKYINIILQLIERRIPTPIDSFAMLSSSRSRQFSSLEPRKIVILGIFAKYFLFPKFCSHFATRFDNRNKNNDKNPSKHIEGILSSRLRVEKAEKDSRGTFHNRWSETNLRNCVQQPKYPSWSGIFRNFPSPIKTDDILREINFRSSRSVNQVFFYCESTNSTWRDAFFTFRSKFFYVI